jgi:transposase
MIINKRKYIIQEGDHPYPHMGAMMQKHIQEKGMIHAVIARKLDIAQTGMSRYLQQPSLQAGILWKMGLVIGHNFFTELGRSFPIILPDLKQEEADRSMAAQLAAKDQRIVELEKELAIYKSIVMAGK